MGNSLQDYRCKIGLFSSNKCGKIRETYENENSRKTKSLKLLPGICLILTLLCLLSPCAPADISARLKDFNPRPIKSIPSSIENHNFRARYLNGNIRRNGIKLSHWNQGPGFLSTKRNEIENIINGYTPHILGISEGIFFHSKCSN